MKNTLLSLVALITLLVPLEFAAAQNIIRLICKYSHAIDNQGERTGVSGEDLITIDYSANGQAVIKTQGTNIDARFIGTISEEKIYGETTHTIEKDSFSQTYYRTLTINRYTGTLETTFGVSEESWITLSYGKCKPVTEKLF